MEGLLLRCLSTEEARIAMGEVHKGMCGAHEVDVAKSRGVLANYVKRLFQILQEM
jgi:hypothetical protein